MAHTRGAGLCIAGGGRMRERAAVFSTTQQVYVHAAAVAWWLYSRHSGQPAATISKPSTVPAPA